MARLAPSLLALATVLGGAIGCSSDEPSPSGTFPSPNANADCRQLDASLAWHEGVREFLQSAIDAHSTCTGTATASQRKVAIFDWDNTVVKNDVGNATNYYMLSHDLVLQPPNQDWLTTSKWMTPEAADALKAACGTDVPAGKPLPTSTNALCADEILAILSDGETTGGKAAFAGFDERRLEPAYAWAAALSAGYTADELAGFAAKAKEENLRADVGAQQKVGTKEVDGFIRVYPQITDLIATLQAHGIDTWVVSASAEPIVKVWADEVGVDDQHVVGVRTVYDQAGKQTAHLVGCGGVPDGDDSVMTYIDGKRCWANQVIFGVTGPDAFNQLPEDRRQVLAAGDSVTDVTFVGDATAASLVINRNKAELMCRAYANQDGRWIVNPMFIDPEPKFADGYPCATKGAIDAEGKEVPIIGDDGVTPIPDQQDTVFG